MQDGPSNAEVRSTRAESTSNSAMPLECRFVSVPQCFLNLNKEKRNEMKKDRKALKKECEELKQENGLKGMLIDRLKSNKKDVVQKCQNLDKRHKTLEGRCDKVSESHKILTDDSTKACKETTNDNKMKDDNNELRATLEALQKNYRLMSNMSIALRRSKQNFSNDCAKKTHDIAQQDRSSSRHVEHALVQKN